MTTRSPPYGMDLIYLLTPTSPPERVQRVIVEARGFIYCVSLTGVTGARTRLSDVAVDLLERVRRRTRIPLALGFGISGPEHLRAVKGVADAVVVGSAFVELLETHDGPNRERAIREYIGALVDAANDEDQVVDAGRASAGPGA